MATPTMATLTPQFSNNGGVVVIVDQADETSFTAASGEEKESSRILWSNSDETNNCNNGQLFQLDLQTDYNSCETSWILERIIIDETSVHVYVDGQENEHFDTASHVASQSLCLSEGRYRFTIYDAFGDGIKAPGYYIVALDGTVLAGSSNFGYEESTKFTVVRPVVSSAVTAAAEVTSETSAEEMDTVIDDIDDTFSTWVPDRLSGIIDLSLVNDGSSKQPPTKAPSSSKPIEPMVQEFNNERGDDGPPSTSSQTWMEILKDDFEHGLGIFHASESDAEYVTYYPFVKERRGVIRLQNEHDGNENIMSSSSIYSNNIVIDPTTSSSSSSKEMSFKLVFSYYANSMEVHDGFCVDYSIDDGSTWHSQKCWHAMDDFNNGMWYDGTAVTFNLKKDHAVDDVYDTVGSFRIRFRCKADSLHDDVLIDKVQLLGLVDGTELKDSI